MLDLVGKGKLENGSVLNMSETGAWKRRKRDPMKVGVCEKTLFDPEVRQLF